MGIYPTERWSSYFERRRIPGGRVSFDAIQTRTLPQTAVFEHSEPGIKRTQFFELICEIEERTDCYCCSCGDISMDVACRNHGWAARRPCELHNMPGTPWGEEMCDCKGPTHIIKTDGYADRVSVIHHKPNCQEGKMPDPVNPKHEGMVAPGEVQL